MPAITIVALSSISFEGKAQPRIVEYVDIHQTCSKSPKRCLKDINNFLNKQQRESRIWFQFKLYQLEALFQLVKFSELSAQIEPWVNREDVPLRFRINVLIYHAKILNGQGEHALGLEYMSKAVKTINDVNSQSYDPMLTVQIANGLNSMREYQQGYDLLKPLIDKYRNRPMAKFKHELYENIGHFAQKLNKLEEHLSYRLQALEWAKEVGNNNQTAISMYNVARAHQFLKNYDQAFYYFAKAEALNALGDSDQNMIYYRRTEMALAMGEIDKAILYFEKLNRHSEFKSTIEQFNQMEAKLQEAKRQVNAQ